MEVNLNTTDHIMTIRFNTGIPYTELLMGLILETTGSNTPKSNPLIVIKM